MKGRLRIGLAALVAALALIAVPQAFAGGTNVFLDPQGGGSGFVTGTVTPGSGSFNCFWTGTTEVGDCAELNLNLNDVVVLTATASVGSTFDGWDGTCIGTIGPSNVCTFTILLGTPASVVVEPLFVTNRTLTVTKTGTGSGTVASATNLINCGNTCSATVPAGTTFVLTATAAPGSIFTGWTGCTANPNIPNQCAITLNSNATVTANFNSLFQLSVSVSGQGTVTSTQQPGINCGNGQNVCVANVASGASVTLNATPAPGQVFVGWSGGGCTGTGVCVVVVTANTTVTATFQLAAVQAVVEGWRTTKNGNVRSTRVNIDADQSVLVQITIRRNGVVLASRTRNNFEGVGSVIVRIPRSVGGGKAKITIVLTNQFDNSKTTRGNVRIPSL